MATGARRQPEGTIEVNGQIYSLATDANSGAPLWAPKIFATQEGDPAVPRRFRINDWSKGMGDSRGAFKGSIEYSETAYLMTPGRLLPGPKINIISTTHDLSVKKLLSVEAPASRVISFGGRYAIEINPSTHGIASTNDLGVGVSILDACLFIDHVAIALGDSTTFWKRNASGAYAVATVTGVNSYARAFGITVDGDLAKGRDAYWQSCSDPDFYGTDGNWSAEYNVGDKSGVITQLGEFGRADYVLKEEGLYSFLQESSKSTNVLPVLGNFRSTENKRWYRKDNRLFLCSYAGLFRVYHQGPARTVGIEEEEFNEGTLRNVYPTAGAAFGRFSWEAWYDEDSNTTYIVQARDAREGDATMGSPQTEVSVIDKFTGKCEAMLIPTNLTSTPELWYGRALTVAYVKLRRDGRPAEYDTTNYCKVYMPRLDFGSPFTVKNFIKWELKGRNASASKTIWVRAIVDEGTEYSVGDAVTAFTNGYAEGFFTYGDKDVGRILQPAIWMSNNSATDPPEVREFVIVYEERPEKTTGFVAVLRLRDSEGADTADRRTAMEQRAALEALFEGAPVLVTDPEGTVFYGRVFNAEGETDYIRASGGGPQQGFQIGVRRVDYS